MSGQVDSVCYTLINGVADGEGVNEMTLRSGLGKSAGSS